VVAVALAAGAAHEHSAQVPLGDPPRVHSDRSAVVGASHPTHVRSNTVSVHMCAGASSPPRMRAHAHSHTLFRALSGTVAAHEGDPAIEIQPGDSVQCMEFSPFQTATGWPLAVSAWDCTVSIHNVNPCGPGKQQWVSEPMAQVCGHVCVCVCARACVRVCVNVRIYVGCCGWVGGWVCMRGCGYVPLNSVRARCSAMLTRT
jgi:hypothetical protein